MEAIYLAIVLAPLTAAIVAGLLGPVIGRASAHWVTIIAVALSFALSILVLQDQLSHGEVFNRSVYTWMVVDGVNMEIGFLIDRLSALMMAVVTFVSLVVHIYTVGYMRDDPGYQRFFSYISLFTFAMLMLVMSNNFLQLFFGWEAVGLVSYLLIGFWYTRPTAIVANLKAFLVNRVGDFGFLLGIATLLFFTGSLDYAEVFADAESLQNQYIEVFAGIPWPAISVACILLFIGAMGKSAQMPLHVWLPDSMEGPTPISALIHAATMVTAGVFMVVRMSPLFEYSEAALSVMLVVGATTALFTGLLGIVQNDIKRIIAYSTLSQLGYMTVALGSSAYAAGIFHLMTHAFFKALLFLAAGSVILALHHEQDIRRMGGLKRYLPITYWTFLAGALALIGFPGTAGFFSKDALIEAVGYSTIPGAGYAFVIVVVGVFVTALYTFRMFFLVFHGQERIDVDARQHLQESPWVVTMPLILLAIPSLFIGWPTIGPVLFGDYFGNSLTVLQQHDVLRELSAGFSGALGFVEHGLLSPTVYLAAAGVFAAWYLYLHNPGFVLVLQRRFNHMYKLLLNKYYFDEFNDKVFAHGSLAIGNICWRVGDVAIIDGAFVNGSARLIDRLSGMLSRIQTGHVYRYAFAMVIGLCAVTGWVLLSG